MWIIILFNCSACGSLLHCSIALLFRLWLIVKWLREAIIIFENMITTKPSSAKLIVPLCATVDYGLSTKQNYQLLTPNY